MMSAAFMAVTPFEIGDRVRSQATGEVKAITDIACIHYLRKGTTEFRYELDGGPGFVAFDDVKGGGMDAEV